MMIHESDSISQALKLRQLEKTTKFEIFKKLTLNNLKNRIEKWNMSNNVESKMSMNGWMGNGRIGKKLHEMKPPQLRVSKQLSVTMISAKSGSLTTMDRTTNLAKSVRAIHEAFRTNEP